MSPKPRSESPIPSEFVNILLEEIKVYALKLEIYNKDGNIVSIDYEGPHPHLIKQSVQGLCGVNSWSIMGFEEKLSPEEWVVGIYIECIPLNTAGSNN